MLTPVLTGFLTYWLSQYVQVKLLLLLLLLLLVKIGKIYVYKFTYEGGDTIKELCIRVS